jgi:microcystin-dependent protein
MSDPFLGEIRMAGFNFAPSGWALCQGQMMSIAQNSALFSLLGTYYGGNGQTTFGLPDFRSRSPVGQGQGLGLSPIDIGEVGGTENVSLTINEMPMHNHLVTGSSSPTVNSTGALAIPATTTAPTSSNSQSTPGTSAILGPSTDPAVGADVRIYSTATANTTLAPIPVAVSGTVNLSGLTTSVAGGSMPTPIRNPFLGINFIIALNGIFPSRS